MVSFKAVIKKFESKGEKTGWTYIEIPADLVKKIYKEDHRSFRVKGRIDDCSIKAMALLPMGEGNYIMALNASVRRELKKKPGAMVHLSIEQDKADIEIPEDLKLCLNDEPSAAEWFANMKMGERNYYIKWIMSAKTEITRAKRIAMAINSFVRKMDFGAMLREEKKNKIR